MAVFKTKFYVFPGDGVPASGGTSGLTWKGTWGNSPGGTSNRTMSLEPVKIRGNNVARTQAETSALTFKGGLIRGVSRTLPAQTISGTLDVMFGVSESATDADMYWKVYAYVTVGLTDAVRGVLLDYEDNTVEWTTTNTGTALPSAQTMSSVAISDGDRIVVELGFIARNALTASKTGTIRAGAMTASEGLTALSDLSAGNTSTTTLASFVTFASGVLVDDDLEWPEDEFATAHVFTGSGSLSRDLRRFTYDANEPTPCSGSVGTTHSRYGSLWGKWVCPVSQSCTVTADLTNTASTFGTCLMVLTGSPGSFVTVGCRSENAASFESFTFAATVGTTYYFLVTSVYFGGGDLVFTFTPDVEPVQVERIIPLEIETWPDVDLVTAMGWIQVLAAGSPTAIQHFFYFGGDSAPFGGSDYFWVGTDTDGQTLRLDVLGSGSPALQTFLGPTLTLATYYHWALVKNGDAFSVYLSTEGGSPLDVSLAIGPETVVTSITPNRVFVFGSPSAIPKAFKIWTDVLTPTMMRLERETYAPVERDDPTPTPTVPYVWNVTPLRASAEAGLAGGGLTDYSGWDHRFSAALFGADVEWPYIVGPRINALAQRTFVDSFDNYIDGYVDGDYFPGVVDPSAFWDFGTQPTFNSYISDGTGLAASKAFDQSTVAGGGASVIFEHDGYTGRCGHVSFYSFKRTAAPNAAAQHGAGMSVEGARSTDPFVQSFGFSNDLNTPDLIFENNYEAYLETVPDVYVPDVFQWFDVYFQLSTVGSGSPVDVNPDGVIRIFVDNVLVYTKTGLRLTVDDTRWSDLINTWDLIGFTWGGVLDGVRISTDCREPPAESTGFLSWVEARWYQP